MFSTCIAWIQKWCMYELWKFKKKSLSMVGLGNPKTRFPSDFSLWVSIRQVSDHCVEVLKMSIDLLWRSDVMIRPFDFRTATCHFRNPGPFLLTVHHCSNCKVLDTFEVLKNPTCEVYELRCVWKMFEPYFEIRFVFRFNKPMMFGVIGGRAYSHFTWISGYIVSKKNVYLDHPFCLLGSSWNQATTNSCLEMVWYWTHKSDINELVYLAPSSIQTLITNHAGHPHVLSSLHSSSPKFACTVACSASVKGCRASSSVSSFWSFFWNLGSPFSF